MQQELQPTEEEKSGEMRSNAYPCRICGALTSLKTFCSECRSEAEETWTTWVMDARKVERKLRQAYRLCMTCTKSSEPAQVHCTSLDCPIYTRRVTWAASLSSTSSPDPRNPPDYLNF